MAARPYLPPAEEITARGGGEWGRKGFLEGGARPAPEEKRVKKASGVTRTCAKSREGERVLFFLL